MATRNHIDVAAMAKSLKLRVETVAHEITQDLAEAVITKTPVDTGFLRGSWFTTIGDATRSYEGSFDKDGSVTVGRISLEISQMKVGQVLNILNGANYAYYVEFGTATMAPRGFVRKVVVDAKQIANRTIARISNS